MANPDQLFEWLLNGSYRLGVPGSSERFNENPAEKPNEDKSILFETTQSIIDPELVAFIVKYINGSYWNS